MGKSEFLKSVPNMLKPYSRQEEAYLEIVVDTDEQKGICYRSDNKAASYGTYGKTWAEVYQKLQKVLIENNHI